MAELQGGVVVLTHGVLMKGGIMHDLQKHVARAGWQTAVFDYSSRGKTVAQNAWALAQFLRRFDGMPIYLVAHSLGGRVCLRCLQDHPCLNVRRFVAIGTPFLGSEVAEFFSRYRFGRWLLGQSLADGGLRTKASAWTGEAEIGVIAGSRRIGVGWITQNLSKPHDGTVTVASTKLPGIKDHIVEPASHTLLLYSEHVAIQVIHFLDFGFFRAD